MGPVRSSVTQSVCALASDISNVVVSHIGMWMIESTNLSNSTRYGYMSIMLFVGVLNDYMFFCVSTTASARGGRVHLHFPE